MEETHMFWIAGASCPKLVEMPLLFLLYVFLSTKGKGVFVRFPLQFGANRVLCYS